MVLSPEEKKERHREVVRRWKQRNKEQIKECGKEYYIKNKDHINQRNKNYKDTPNGKKSERICRWKQQGVINEDFDTLYDLYINTDKCMYCEKVFADSYDRCLDHDHKDGSYRAVLCRVCNTKDVLN